MKEQVKYRRKKVMPKIKKGLMPPTTPNLNPDDIEIGDEIYPDDRLLNKKTEDH